MRNNSEEIIGINKQGVLYELSSGLSNENLVIYVKNSARIVKQEDGYRWQDKMGNWAFYDSSFSLISFGNRTGTLGKLLYQNNEVIGIADRNDQQVIWIEELAVRDSDNRRVEYRYINGDLTSVVDVLREEIFYEYQGSNQNKLLISKKYSDGRITNITYDNMERPVAVKDANGDGYTFEYDYISSKKVYYIRMVSSSGKVKETWFDKDGETKRVDINGRTIRLLDKNTGSLKITDEKGNVTQKFYDEWDNLTQVIYPDGSRASFEYEYKFNRIKKIVDRRGYVVDYIYDNFGNLLEKREAVGSDDERVTSFAYDADHQLVSMIRPGNAVTLLTYDSLGNVTSITDALDHKMEFSDFDVMGNARIIKDNLTLAWNYADYNAFGGGGFWCYNA